MPSIRLNKQRWKQVLLIAAAVIAGATLWFTNDITKQVKKQERAKVDVWYDEVVSRSEVVANYTEQLFKELQEGLRLFLIKTCRFRLKPETIFQNF